MFVIGRPGKFRPVTARAGILIGREHLLRGPHPPTLIPSPRLHLDHTLCLDSSCDPTAMEVVENPSFRHRQADSRSPRRRHGHAPSILVGTVMPSLGAPSTPVILLAMAVLQAQAAMVGTGDAPWEQDNTPFFAASPGGACWNQRRTVGTRRHTFFAASPGEGAGIGNAPYWHRRHKLLEPDTKNCCAPGGTPCTPPAMFAATDFLNCWNQLTAVLER